jgi:hypothetical protein
MISFLNLDTGNFCGGTKLTANLTEEATAVGGQEIFCVLFGASNSLFKSQLTGVHAGGKDFKVLLYADFIGKCVTELNSGLAPDGVAVEDLSSCLNAVLVDRPNIKRPSGCLEDVDEAGTTPLVAQASSDAITNPGLSQFKLFLTKFVREISSGWLQ